MKGFIEFKEVPNYCLECNAHFRDMCVICRRELMIKYMVDEKPVWCPIKHLRIIQQLEKMKAELTERMNENLEKSQSSGYTEFISGRWDGMYEAYKEVLKLFEKMEKEDEEQNYD